MELCQREARWPWIRRSWLGQGQGHWGWRGVDGYRWLQSSWQALVDDLMWTLRGEEEVRVTPSFWLEQSGEWFYHLVKRPEWSDCKLARGPLRNAWDNVEGNHRQSCWSGWNLGRGCSLEEGQHRAPWNSNTEGLSGGGRRGKEDLKQRSRKVGGNLKPVLWGKPRDAIFQRSGQVQNAGRVRHGLKTVQGT